MSQRAQQVLTRGLHKNLRYHARNLPNGQQNCASRAGLARKTAASRDNLNFPDNLENRLSRGLPRILNRGMTLHSALRIFRAILFLLFSLSLFASFAAAEGTRAWEQSKFDDLVKGTTTGVAIRSSGGLELAPSFKLLYSTPSTYIWAIAADDSGNVYAATGSPARVYRITSDGKSSIIFQPQELQVQALRVGPGGVIYAATAPDGKVYKIEHKPGNKKENRNAESKSSRDAA